MKAAEVAQQQATVPIQPGDLKRQTAMEFLEQTINDDTVDRITRVNAAKALLPYQERKAVDTTGKKAAKQEQAQAALKGKFAPMKGPKVVPLKGGQG